MNKDKISEIFNIQSKNAVNIRNSDFNERIKKIQLIIDWIYLNEDSIKESLKKDLSKPALETNITEIWVTVDLAKNVIRNLKRWMKRKRVSSSLSVLLAKSYVEYYPKGICLVISPWNYPFQLCLAPLIYSIAAGNCTVIKPSEITPSTSNLVSRMIGELFNQNEVAVIEGGQNEAEILLEQPFNHIFFTGSDKVGEKIVQASSKHLSSFTLELGGKSPVFIDKGYNLDKVINRLIAAKFVNLGQSCIAPDYLIIHKDDYNLFIDKLSKAIDAAYGSTISEKISSDSLARIVNDNHFNRLASLIDSNSDSIVFGGEVDKTSKFISPTVLDGNKLNGDISCSEIFGPVLPVFTYEEYEDLSMHIDGMGNPLALYIFSINKAFIDNIKNKTSSGGVCVNDIGAQFLNHNLPFGGVMRSGSGRYHGYAGFKEFSNQRSIIYQSRLNFLSSLSPPYTNKIKKMVDILLKFYKKI